MGFFVLFGVNLPRETPFGSFWGLWGFTPEAPLEISLGAFGFTPETVFGAFGVFGVLPRRPPQKAPRCAIWSSFGRPRPKLLKIDMLNMVFGMVFEAFHFLFSWRVPRGDGVLPQNPPSGAFWGLWNFAPEILFGAFWGFARNPHVGLPGDQSIINRFLIT